MTQSPFRALLLAFALAGALTAPLGAQQYAALSVSPGAEAAQWAARHLEAPPRRLTAPDFPIRHADGRTGSLADYKGRAVVVTLWKSDCPICRRELPILDRLAAELGPEGVVFAPLTLDVDLERARFAASDWGLRSLPVIQDVERFNGSIFALEVHGRPAISTPTTYILDKSGAIRGTVWGGGDWESPGAKAWLRALAAEAA